MQPAALFAVVCCWASLIVTPERGWAAFAPDTRIRSGPGLAPGFGRQSGSASSASHRAARVLHLGQLGAPLPEDMTWDDSHRHDTRHQNTNHDRIIGRSGQRLHHELVPQIEVVYDNQGRAHVESIRQVDPLADRLSTEERNAPHWTAGKGTLPTREVQEAERRATDHLGREVINGVAYLEINHGTIGSGTRVPSGSIHYSQVPFPIAPTRTVERPPHTGYIATTTEQPHTDMVHQDHEDVEDSLADDEPEGSESTVTTAPTSRDPARSQEYSSDEEAPRADIETGVARSHEPRPPDTAVTQDNLNVEEPDEDEDDEEEDYPEETPVEVNPMNTTTSLQNHNVTSPNNPEARTDIENDENETDDEMTTTTTSHTSETTNTPNVQELPEDIHEPVSNRTTVHSSEEFEDDASIEDSSEENATDSIKMNEKGTADFSSQHHASNNSNNNNNNSNTQIDVASHSRDSDAEASTKSPLDKQDYSGAIEDPTTINVDEKLPEELIESDDSSEDVHSTTRNDTVDYAFAEQEVSSEAPEASTPTELAMETSSQGKPEVSEAPTVTAATAHSTVEPQTSTTTTTTTAATTTAAVTTTAAATTTATTTTTATKQNLVRPYNQTENKLRSVAEAAATRNNEETTPHSDVAVVTEHNASSSEHSTTAITNKLPNFNVSDTGVNSKVPSGAAVNETEISKSDILNTFVTVDPSMFYGIVREITDPPATTEPPVIPSSKVQLTSEDALEQVTEPTQPAKSITIQTFEKTTEPSADFALGLEGLFQLKFRPGSQSEAQSKINTVRHPKMIDINVNTVSDGHKRPSISTWPSHQPTTTRSSIIRTILPTTTSRPVVIAPASANLPVNSIPSLFSNGDPSVNMMSFPWGIFDTKDSLKDSVTEASISATQTSTLLPNNGISLRTTAAAAAATTTTTTSTSNISKVNLFTKKSLPSVAPTRSPSNAPAKKFNLFASLTNATSISYSGNGAKRDHRRPELRPLATRPQGAWEPSIEPAPEDASGPAGSRPQIVGKKARFGRPDRRLTMVEPRALPVPPPRIPPPIADTDIDLIHRGTPPAPRNGKQPISTRARTTLLMSASLITGAAIFFATLLAVCRRRAKNARLLRRRAVEAFIHDAASEASSNYGYGGSAYSYGRKGLLPPRV